MRRVNVHLMRTCVTLLAVGLMAAAAQATLIEIANPGFDSDSLASNPDGYAIGAPTGWIATGIGAGYQLGGDGLAARSGENWGFLSPGNNDGGAGLGQLLTVGGSALNAANGGRITIDAYQGHRADYQGEGYTQEFQIQIWRDAIGTDAGGTLAGDSGDFGDVTPGANSWTQRSYSYVATGDDVGKSLYVLLLNPGHIQVQVEDVSGAYTIPEPCSLALLGTGVLGLLAYAWRRQR